VPSLTLTVPVGLNKVSAAAGVTLTLTVTGCPTTNVVVGVGEVIAVVVLA
jgi:hypothetical protein